jgi:(4-(4-[2-(gamma-L-glutamylamino)ethyl]phenoxymethyl)furan-2-yl)methanamine synthase
MIALGWDIGGSNTKICRIVDGQVAAAVCRPFEVRDAPQELAEVLRALAAEVGAGHAVDAHAVTMTAELSRTFLTKRAGVAFVLDAVESALGHERVHVFTVDGVFVTPAEARHDPLRVAAANWMATAALVSRTHPDAVVIDIGTTTTDVIPIVAGRVEAAGRTDPERLASGELLYTGAVRTPVEALATDVGVLGRRYPLAAEGFATSADVHLWRGDLVPGDVTGGTADGRPATRTGAGDRLARALCGDRELLDDAAVTALADALAAAQIDRVAATIRRVVSRHPSIRHAVVAGVGAFIAARAAGAAGLEVRVLADTHGDGASRCAPAAAVALLLDGATQGARTWAPVFRPGRSLIDMVVKVGGSLLGHETALTTVLDALGRSVQTLVVPGGGPFADAVREVYHRGAVGDDAAHWMAVLAMDQYAELLAERMPGSALVTNLADARRAVAVGRVPVLAPSRWLREADPLPHTWDVTSDSLAAWVAGQAGAARLLLVKPAGAAGTLTDAYFGRALPPGVTCEVISAGDLPRFANAWART